MNDKYTKISEKLKAIAEPTRLKILEMLTKEEMCVCEVINKLSLSQPAVSHHLKILRQVDLIQDRKEGKWVFYSVNKTAYLKLIQTLQINFTIDKQLKEKQKPTICCNIKL